MVPLHAITNFISPTCDYVLDKFKRLTSHCFYMQYLTTTFLFKIILVACEGSTSKKQVEIMVALATLALQSAKKLYLKGSFENKI